MLHRYATGVELVSCPRTLLTVRCLHVFRIVLAIGVEPHYDIWLPDGPELDLRTMVCGSCACEVTGKSAGVAIALEHACACSQIRIGTFVTITRVHFRVRQSSLVQ